MPTRTEYIQECRQMLELLNPSDLRYVYFVLRALTGKGDDRHEGEDKPGRTPERALTADCEDSIRRILNQAKRLYVEKED